MKRNYRIGAIIFSRFDSNRLFGKALIDIQGRSLLGRVIDRAKRLFSANWANVQPHSGAQANFAVFLSLLKPGDRIMGMDLSHGGHLTHGSPVNVSGKWFKTCHYEVDQRTEMLDMEAIRNKAIENHTYIR